MSEGRNVFTHACIFVCVYCLWLASCLRLPLTPACLQAFLASHPAKNKSHPPLCRAQDTYMFASSWLATALRNMRCPMYRKAHTIIHMTT